MDEFILLGQRWLQVMLRAGMVLGPMCFLFWILRPKHLAKYRIHQPREIAPKVKEEFPFFILGLSVYLIPSAIGILVSKYFGYSMMYTDIAEFGWPYFFLTIFIFAFTIDTWFYWTHRLMHSHPYFKSIHRLHHRSYNVTPISSYSFHFTEGLLNMAPYGALIFLIPWHPLALTSFGFFGIFYVGYIHLGYDVPAHIRRKSPLFKIFYSSTQHSIHHHLNDHNFAVYFSFWDRVMKTEKIEH